MCDDGVYESWHTTLLHVLYKLERKQCLWKQVPHTTCIIKIRRTNIKLTKYGTYH